MKKSIRSGLWGLAVQLLCIQIFTVLAEEIEIKPGGKGLHLKSDEKGEFRLRGYVQPSFILSYPYEEFSFEYTNFFLRRARLDFTFKLPKAKMFLELDGAPGDGFTLPQAYAQYQWTEAKNYVRFGKMSAPFSGQNLRSSRSLLAVERFMALRALNKLPAAEKVLGLMLTGELPESIIYYLGVFNGATSGGSGAKLKDNNKEKELEGRVETNLGGKFGAGLGFLYAEEGLQVLKIRSYTGATFYQDSVTGKRYGVDVNFKWESGNLFLDGEILYIGFTELESRLLGGYFSWAHWIMGNSEKGLQALLRVDYAEYLAPGNDFFKGNSVISFITGLNVHLNPNARIILDVVTEKNLDIGIMDEKAWRPSLISQYVLKL